MRTVVIIQARTTSTRLPAKAFLPVAGYPSAVLCALRAANQGSEALVATSHDPTDDLLADEIRSHGVGVFRGALHDVLDRYAKAASDFSDDSILVRLTGDNVLPDGNFVQDLADAFAASRLEYLAVASPQSRLPYGLGAEAFSVAALRKAHSAAISAHDREHVGPWMSRNCRGGIHIPRAIGGVDYSHLRCTIDDAEDYRRMLRLFEGVVDPVHVRWHELLRKLALLPGEPRFRVPYRVSANRIHSELTVGTAQMGMDYGIVNRTGQPSRWQAVSMVRDAVAHGVTSLDTARAYGDAEGVLGEALSGAWRSRAEVITKLDPLALLSADADSATVNAAIDESVHRSCKALKTKHLPTLLLHRWSHRSMWQGAAWQRLLDLRAKGTISVLGASIYEPTEALDALRDPAIQHLQIPLNVLDQRWKASGIERALVERPDVIVHARSAFLQGILIHPLECWPKLDGYDVGSCIHQLRRMAGHFGREGLADLCLSYVRSQPWITSVVLGCETQPQLEENLRLFCLPKLSSEQCSELEHALPPAPENLLNPSKWTIVHERHSTLQ